MGIPFYYSDLIKKYPDIIQNPKNVNILFFDYNGLIQLLTKLYVKVKLKMNSFIYYGKKH